MIYFMPVFSDPTYSESRLLPFGSKPDAEWIEEYNYELDSDLGYFSDDEHSGTEDASVLPQNGQASICSGECTGSVVCERHCIHYISSAEVLFLDVIEVTFC
jgi:hypothetical protein